MPRPGRRTRGFTVIEIIVAATLSAVLGLAIASVLVSSSSLSKLTLTKASAEQQVRDLNQTVVRYVRSAAPRGRCLSPAGPTSSCLVVGEESSPFASVEPSRLVFYAYTSDRPAVSSRQLAPDRVTIEAILVDTAVVLEVKVERATSGYTDTWTGESARVARRVVLAQPSDRAPALPQLFTFLDLRGQATTTLEEIAVVVFDPQVRVEVDGTDRVFGAPVFVAIPSKGFGG